MTGFRNAQLKQTKQIFLTLNINLSMIYQNMFIDSLVLHVYSVSYFRPSCDFNVMS